MNAEVDELIREFVANGGDPQEWWRHWHGSYSIAPTDSAPIVRDRGDGRFLELVRWDWESPPRVPKNKPVINATIEKLVSGFWTPAFTAARCVVPMLGYYEWTGEPGRKTAHWLHGDGLMAAAGLTWSMDVNGEATRCFVVVTREARDVSGEVHSRMPAFLTEEAKNAWLEPVKLDRAGRTDMHGTLLASSEEMAATIRTHTVDRRVNNARAVDPSDSTLIERVA